GGLVWGGWIVRGVGGGLAVWLWAGLAGRPAFRGVLVVPLVALALAAAGYSAFLFAQAEGRDAWQSALVLPHLLVSALTAGVAVALLAYGPSPRLRGGLLVGLGAGLLLLLAELYTPHADLDTRAAARAIPPPPHPPPLSP